MKKQMSGLILGLSLSAAYILGCATSQVVPGATAQPPPPGVQTWAYECTDGYNAGTITERANALGAQGWEMVAAVGSERVRGLWCFKRPR